VGTDSWQAGLSGDWNTSTDWSGGIPTSATSAAIAGPGSYVVTLFAAGTAYALAVNDSGAEFYDAGALTLGGALTLQAGTLALAYGAIDGGTLIFDGGIFQATGGTLNGVAIDGTLNLGTPDSTLFVQNGLTLAGVSGSGAGSIALTGGYAALDFIGSQALSNTVIALGATGSQPGQTGQATLEITHAGGATSGATLTLAANVLVRDAGGQGALVAGSLSPVQGASLPDALVNQGTITVSGAGGTLSIGGTGTLTNQGTLAVSNGGVLEIATAGFVNTGSISVGSGYFALGGTFSAALINNLGSVTNSGGLVEILGLANNTGTLALGAGYAISAELGPVVLAGTLRGGTLINAGGGVSFLPGTGILDGVSYVGTLGVVAANAGVTLTDGTEISSPGGGAGSLTISGNGGSLLLEGSETLNNATIALGAAGQAAQIGTADAWLASTATTATLGAALLVQQAGANAMLNANAFSPIPGFGLSDTLVNEGVIIGALSGGQLGIGGYGSFINQGSIAISGGDTLSVTAGQFGNTGTITAGAGGTILLGATGSFYGTPPAWSNAGQILVTGGTLVLGGAVTTLQLGSIRETAGSVQLAGTLTNAGATFSLGAGTSLQALSLSGTILGGTIADSSSALSAGAAGTGLLDGVTYQGTLALSQSDAYLTARDGLTVSALVDILGAGSELDFLGSQVFRAPSVMLGSAGAAASIALSHNYAASGASILTLGSATTITQAGALAQIGQPGGVAGDAIVNAGTINAGIAQGSFVLGGTDVVNQGQINVSNGDTLSIQSAQFSNTGTVSASNAQVSLAGSLTLAGLGQVSLTNAVLAVSGTLNLAGGTLSIGQGSAIGRLSLTGTLSNGTIIDGGLGLADAGGADLAGITYDGVLDLSRPFATLGLSQGISLAGQNGSGTGSILLTGAQTRLVANSTETIGNAVISLGSVAQTYSGQVLAAPELDAAAGVQLTLGARTTITMAGTAGTLGDAGLGQWTDSIVNAGQITDSIAADTLTLASSFFTNAGTLSVLSAGIMVIGDVGFTNTGTLAIGTSSVVQVSLYDFFAAPNAGSADVSNSGIIAMGGGILHEMTAGGLFPNVPFANLASGDILGKGTVISSVTNSGTIEANGGVLSIQGTVLGTGTLQIDAGATLDLAGIIGAGQTANFSSTSGTLKLEQPSNFFGTIGNFTGGDVIDLPGQNLTALAISNGTLVANTATHQYRLTSVVPLAGVLEAGRDGVGGATIVYIPHSGGGVGGGPMVLSVSQPNMLFWTTPSGDILTGSSANMSGLDVCNWSDASSLDITDMAPASAKLTSSITGGVTHLTVSNGTHTVNMTIGASLASSGFTLAADGHGGTVIAYPG